MDLQGEASRVRRRYWNMCLHAGYTRKGKVFAMDSWRLLYSLYCEHQDRRSGVGTTSISPLSKQAVSCEDVRN